MFKLESYITPIILNHVAKYVKNIRPQDAQVSLWEGEVAFQNLDLRLDVLEEELNLPFEFLSGHIHELIIHVPWTKINSEPINITINTIEFVLKLKDQNVTEPTSTAGPSSPTKVERKKKVSKVEDYQQGGYMPGLVNKIINNIALNCHNIILKYVEEDIVVSMNVQLLSLESADETWKPAFIDINPTKFLMRKLIQISDLTICLDKRNSMGQIDVCQEPILYKCSLEMRLIRKSSSTSTTTCAAVSTESIEMNVSSLQFPMAIRLFNLILALKSGDLKTKLETDILNSSIDEIDTQLNDDESYFTWAWNLLPSFNFDEISDEEKRNDLGGHILDVGIYIKNFKFTLKSSEFVNESIVGTTKKIRYNSILNVYMSGIFMETLIAEGQNWFNTKAGISKITVEPLGTYSDDSRSKYLLSAETNIKSNFMTDSLFDDHCSSFKLIMNIEEYLEKNTQQYLTFRAPCFVTDMIQYKECAGKNENSDANKAGDPDTKHVQDHLLTRVFLSTIKFQYSLSFNKILDTINDLIAMYDYPPYTEQISPSSSSKLPPPLLDDFDSLMADVPIKIYEFYLNKLSLELHPKDEIYLKNSTKIKTIQRLPTKLKAKLPHFVLTLESLHGKWTTPLDPDLLVHTTCQLPEKPKELLNACYNNYEVNFKNISIKLADSASKYTLIQIPKGDASFGKILHPNLWKDEDIAHQKISLFFESFQVNFTNPQLLLALSLAKTLTEFNNTILMDILKSKARIDIQNLKFPKIENNFSNFSIEFYQFINTLCCKGHLKALNSIITSKETPKTLLFESDSTASKKKWFEWSGQIPKDFHLTKHPPFIALRIQTYSIIINTKLINFLQYTNSEIDIDRDSSQEIELKPTIERKSSKKSITSERNSRKISHPEETIHFSSEKDEHADSVSVEMEKQSHKFSNNELIQVLKAMFVNVELDHGSIYIIEGNFSHVHSIENNNSTENNQYSKILLPNIVCKSAVTDDFLELHSKFPFIQRPIERETFPWSCAITSFIILSRTKNKGEIKLLHSVETNITLALTHKKETVCVGKCSPTDALDQIQEQFHAKEKKTKHNEDRKSKFIEFSVKEKLVNESSSKSEISISSEDNIEEKTKFSRGSKQPKTKEIKDHIRTEAVAQSSPKKVANDDSLDIKKQKFERDSFAINLHIDTSPIFIEISVEQANFIHPRIEILSQVINLLMYSKTEPIIIVQDNLKIITNLEDDPNIKEFLEFDTNSESSGHISSKIPNKFVISTWLQWTITKFTLSIEGFGKSQTKLTIEMEDLISSLDKQIDYTKIKSKLGTFSVRYFELNEKHEWQLDDSLKIKMQTENSQSQFIDLIVTFADTKSVFKKMGARKRADLNHQLCEIVVSMQAVEILLDLDRLSEFVPVYCAFNQINAKPLNENINNNQEKYIQPYIVSNLPLVYFESKGLTIYSPVKVACEWCSVFILKINEIKLSPNVENPLTRIPVRSDVYNKAAQMGLLNTPGSIIEDRQYEVCFNNISAATGNWDDLLAYMKEHTNNFHNTNPAFEWNNQNRSKTSLELREIFSNFIIAVTYAPCIVYNQVLICGQAIEFNCLNDLSAKITTDQLTMFSCILLNLQNIETLSCPKKSSLKTKSSTSLKSTQSEKISVEQIFKRTESLISIESIDSKSINRKNIPVMSDVLEEPFTDSGISTYEKIKRKSIRRSRSSNQSLNNNSKGIPFELSFVAGIFNVKCYHFNRKKRKRSTVHQGSTNYEEHLTPLCACTINQPCMLISQKIFGYSIQISLHNFIIYLSKFSTDQIEQNKDFPVILFDTKPGKKNMSGIPPSLLSIKIHLNKAKKCEIECNIGKPLTAHLSHKSIEKLVNIWIVINEAIMMSPCYEITRPIVRGSKIQMIKNAIYNADRLHLKIGQITVKSFLPSEYEIKMIFDNLICDINFFNRPEKLNLIWQLGAFYIQTESKIFLHPVGIKVVLELIQENWYHLPLITTNINLNIIHVDLGVENIQHFFNALNHFKESLIQTDKLLEQLEEQKKLFKQYQDVNKDNMESVSLPQVHSKLELKRKEEFYQDDLRAGAFQFIETFHDSALPMPYQIQIIKKNNGIICWRYPQPRKISKLHIYPVPMPIANPMQIKCQMEYYSDSHQSFQHYCDFYLSETESIEIKLPERLITATIWRVIILQSLVSINGECFDTSEEDEELQSIARCKIEDMLNTIKNESDFKLNPKVLVGCMRIDTSFNPDFIPKINIILDISLLEINLQNQEEKCNKMPVPFAKFKLSNEFSPVETFLSIKFTNFKAHSSILSFKNYTINTETGFNVKCLDYGFSNMTYIIEDIYLKSYAEVFSNSITSNFVADIVKINLGPGVLHALIVSAQQWQDRIIFPEESQNHFPIFTRFVIANRTQFTIIYGQTNTNQRLHLESKQCAMYSFISDFHDQELTFYNTEDDNDLSEPIGIDLEEKVRFIKIADNILVIRTKKISSTQVAIFIKGQIELLSMVNEEFKLQFRSINLDGTYSVQSPEYILEPKCRVSFCQKVLKDVQTTVRLKFISSKTKGWTGDIPLRSNKNLPWLVKVPINGTEHFISYWVRIVREDIKEMSTSLRTPQRILITIWPIYIIQSMFTNPMLVHESTTNADIQINGEGASYELNVPATHQTDHNITFYDSFEASHGEDKQKALLSLKSIDWNNFFWYDEKYWTIEKCLTELSRPVSIKWPYSDEEEHKITRYSNKIHIPTLPIYKCYPSRDFSCSLTLEVAPWCLFINSFGKKIRIKNNETNNSVIIDSNKTSSLFFIDKSFTIEIEKDSNNWLQSLPIFFDKNLCSRISETERFVINDDDQIEIILSNRECVYKILLKSIIESNRKVLVLKPTFVLTNFSNKNFKYIPFCLESNETVRRTEITNLAKDVNKFYVPKSTKSKNCIGLSVDYFYDLNIKSNKRNHKSIYVFYICITSIKGYDITIPIPVTSIFNRKCFSLQKDSESIPLAVNILLKDGQHFINIFNDSCPTVLIDNRTELNFLIAQTNCLENNASKTILVTPECDKKNFEWYQILRKSSQLYFTPPEMYTNFPDIEPVSCNIAVALLNEDSSNKSENIRWSKPIRTDISCEKFFHIPLHGDVKLIVCDKHKCIKISIFYIAQQLEFSVKDLRSRLLSPDQQTDLIKLEEKELLLDSASKDQNHQYTKCNHDISNDNKFIFDLRFFVKESVISLFQVCKKRNYIKTEILSIYIDDMIVEFNAPMNNVNLLIANLQIDNQLFSSGNYDFPVILCAQDIYNRSAFLPSIYSLGKIIEKFDQNSLFKINLQYHENYAEIRSITCKINPVRAYIEDTYLNDLFDYLLECEFNNVAFKPKLKISKIELPEGCILIPEDIENQAIYLSEPIKLEYFRIEPMNVMFSVHTCIRLYIALDHSPLEFSTYERRNILTLPQRFGHTVGMHYLSGAIFGAGWVVGSLEILGSPSGLARSFSMGLRDFVTMPLEGFLRGPWGFIVGITQGSASLLRNITAGTVNSVTKLAASVARNIDRFTLDDEHFLRTEALRRTRPQGFTEGFSQGLTGLGISILGAVGGIARHTLEARSPVQVVTGMGKGIVGAFTKPISGAAELVALTGHGVLHSVGFNTMPKQRSPSISRNTAVHPADYKMWRLLPKILQSDQILYFNEATLVTGDHLKRATICLTSSVLAVLELDKNELSYILPVDKVVASFDKNDRTLINVNLQYPNDEYAEEMLAKKFTQQRIMEFLESSKVSERERMSWDSLEDLLIADKIGKKLDWSFYISEDLGQHLLQYLKIIKSKSNV